MQSSNVSPLLTTSLRIPQLHAGLITRSVLLDRMRQALNFPLTLILAPAGFGKSTLLSQWISCSKDLQDRAAWVSLENEGDARQFWSYIVTALEEIQPEVGRFVRAYLEVPQPPIHAILRILINEISQVSKDFVLVLDDYHHVDDPAIHDTFTFFIDHLPANLHLVLLSRSQPPLSLARWRASNRLYELREEDLRFTDAEATAFLNEVKGLRLLPEEIAALETRTEGWIAGLQLVALSLQGHDEKSQHSFVSAFTGSQRYILDYLAEEVLQRQPDSIKTFLLRTSILDRFNASLCNALTGRNDGQSVLEYLERGHLFTIPLDQEQHWYRYHHLFRDVLYHQLTRTKPNSVLELHRRAAAWYVWSGQTDDAIRHASAAQEWQQAIKLIKPAINTAWNRGEVRKIITWLGKLPDDQLGAHPQLSLYYSRALLLGGKMDAAEQRLRESEKVLRARPSTELDSQDRLLLGTVCAFRTTIAAVTGETESALALGQEALNLLPSDNIDVRAHTTNSLGVNYYYLGAMEDANRACSEAGTLAQQAGNLYLAMVAASYRAKALVCQGQLTQAEGVIQQALDMGSSLGLPIHSRIPAASVVCSSFADLLYEWNKLEEAEHYVTDALELGQRLAFGSALWSAYYTLARIRLARGDQKGAEMAIENLHRYRLTSTVPLPARLMNAEQARANLMFGRLEAVKRWMITNQTDKPRVLDFIQEVEDMTLARFYLFSGQPDLTLRLLYSFRTSTETSERKAHLIEILVLTALSHHALGDDQQAFETLHKALEMAEPEGYMRTFVDAGQPMAALLYKALTRGAMPNYVRRLLSIFPADDAASNSTPGRYAAQQARSKEKDIIEPLSERELEVLQLMAGGASNQEIAETLVIALTTAKKHVSNIIRKLGVDNRTQAVAIGRNLGLCQ